MGIEHWIFRTALPLVLSGASAGLGLAQVPPLAADSAKQAVARGADAQAKSAEAMQKAQRAAEGPLRAILEASKVKRRVEPDGQNDVETVAVQRRAAAPARGAAAGAVAAAAAAPVAVAARAERAEAVAPRAAAAAVVTPVAPVAAAAPAAVPDAPRAADAAGAPAGASSEQAEPTIRSLPGDTVEAAASKRGPPALEATALAPLGSARAAAVLPPVQPVPAQAEQRPELLHMVEPVVPQRLLDQLTRPEVTVELTIRTDGTVAVQRVLPPVPRQIVPAVIEALEQWRYGALPQPRQHRVLLVFTPPGG